MALSSSPSAADSVLTDARLEQIRQREAELQSSVNALQQQCDDLADKFLNPNAPADVNSTKDGLQDRSIDVHEAAELANHAIKTHIQELQRYNEIRDIGMQLMGMIAENKGIRIAEVQKDFGIKPQD